VGYLLPQKDAQDGMDRSGTSLTHPPLSGSEK
jgi:hypothetical protein